jgi:AraC family transcriptional regulator
MDVMARIPKLTTTLAYDRYMAGQKLVSSVDRPWRHLVLRSYLEPAEQELLEAPGLQDLTLMTLASGAEHLERNLNGCWENADLRAGDVWFVPPAPISWRWRSISDEPLSTVHLHIERGLIDSVADQMELGGSRELSLGDAMQFQDPLIAAMLGALHCIALHCIAPPPIRPTRVCMSMRWFTRSPHICCSTIRAAAMRRPGRLRSPSAWCRAGFAG